MAMKQRGGTKSKTIEGMLNVFQSTFSRSGMKQMSRICAYKTERTLQMFWLMHTIPTVMSVDSTVLLLSTKTKQENPRNEASRLSENVSKKSSALSHIKYGEVSLQIEFATLPPINHDLLVKEE
jgi:hypothetical protein